MSAGVTEFFSPTIQLSLTSVFENLSLFLKPFAET